MLPLPRHPSHFPSARRETHFPEALLAISSASSSRSCSACLRARSDEASSCRVDTELGSGHCHSLHAFHITKQQEGGSLVLRPDVLPDPLNKGHQGSTSLSLVYSGYTPPSSHVPYNHGAQDSTLNPTETLATPITARSRAWSYPPWYAEVQSNQNGVPLEV